MKTEEKILNTLEKFREEINEIFIGKTPKLEGEIDNKYVCDIYIFRHPGMGNSKQIILGDTVSILTATASYLQTLLQQEILDEENLKSLLKMVIKEKKDEFNNAK